MGTTVEVGSSLAKLQKLNSVEIAFWWPLVRQVMLEHPRGWDELTTIEAIHSVVTRGALHLWIVVDEAEVKLAALAHTELHAKRSSYVIVWCGGKEFTKYGLQGLRGIEDWARLQGFHNVSLQGRRGWLRLLRKAGYVEHSVALRKPLTPHVQGNC